MQSCPRPGATALPLSDIPWTRCASSLLLAAATAALRGQDEGLAGRLREVHITTGDVFASAEQTFLTKVVNSLHWQTRESVIATELWVRPGDHVDAAMAAELERNLRALRLFADVSVRLVATATPGEVDLEIVTRDRLTLAVGAGASYVGGVGGYRFALGEGSMFGLGDRLVTSFAENTDGEYRGSIAYSDLHVLDTWHTASVRLSRTDEGDSGGFELRRPFKHLADPRAWATSLAVDESEADYYRGGDTVAEVPFRRAGTAGDLTWGSGPRDARRYFGVAVAAEDIDYGTAHGPMAPAIDVPGDIWSVFVGPTAAWEWIDGYRKVEGLDTLDYVQDLTLGLSLHATVGARWRDEAGVAAALQPEFAAGAGHAAEPLTDLFTNLGARGALRLDDANAVGWSVSAWARAFALVGEDNTLAGSCTFDAVEETQDLARELTLGEDNGLRGYRARQFAGTRRLRTNLEDRFDTGIEWATLRLGLVAFQDTGWVGTGGDLGRPYLSAGVGLRIASKPLLGDGVFRVDLARPLDEVPGESDGWSLSVTVGQVFTFGGNAGGLPGR